ncbi:MAG: DUF1302 domain-containing protein [Trinickia sp.]
MRRTRANLSTLLAFAVLGGASTGAAAYDFKTGIGDLSGSWVTNLTAGAGIRTKNPSCSLTGDPDAYGCGAGANVAQWGMADDGDLNYKKGHAFTGYVSATTELLFTMPNEGYKFMVRGTGMYDFMADRTARSPLSGSANQQMKYPIELLDLWAEKDFALHGEQAHVRLGNQVINWGESVFASGGINATNALDIQKLLVPGTQLKQALLPAPMFSFASGLGHGLSTEAYYQFRWNRSQVPAVGSYWSVTNNFGRGTEPTTIGQNGNLNVGGVDPTTLGNHLGQSASSVMAGLQGGAYLNNGMYSTLGIPGSTVSPPKYKPQFGIKLNYKPHTLDANFAFYYENYTDKLPVFSYLANGTTQWQYLQHRQLFGLSANFPLGDWSIGTELSYRPHDAVALTGCYGAGGPLDTMTNGVAGACNAYADKKKFQLDVNAQLMLTQSDYPFLKLLHADMAVLTAEVTWIDYPGVNSSGVQRTVNGTPVTQGYAAGYYTWLNYGSGQGYPIASSQGTSSSVGATVDFNWTYDGSVIPGWQLTPGLTFSDALYGYTPNLMANYLQGAKSLNVYVLLNQNPAKWQLGMNYTAFWGGHGTVGQAYADRNFVGLFATRNF